MTKDHTVILFMKSPEKGRVKTRLAKGVGKDKALELYQCFVMDLLDMLGATPWALRVYYYPEKACSRIKSWLGNRLEFFPQEGATLGEKMKNALEETFAAGYKNAVLIGADLPDLPPEIIDTAFGGLNGHSAVIGPSPDGGYYLIGFTAQGFAPKVFNDIPWGTGQVFDQTLERFLVHGVNAFHLPPFRDMDTLEDLKTLYLDRTDGLAGHTTHYLKKRGMTF